MKRRSSNTQVIRGIITKRIKQDPIVQNFFDQLIPVIQEAAVALFNEDPSSDMFKLEATLIAAVYIFSFVLRVGGHPDQALRAVLRVAKEMPMITKKTKQVIQDNDFATNRAKTEAAIQTASSLIRHTVELSLPDLPDLKRNLVGDSIEKLMSIFSHLPKSKPAKKQIHGRGHVVLHGGETISAESGMNTEWIDGGGSLRGGGPWDFFKGLFSGSSDSANAAAAPPTIPTEDVNVDFNDRGIIPDTGIGSSSAWDVGNADKNPSWYEQNKGTISMIAGGLGATAAAAIGINPLLGMTLATVLPTAITKIGIPALGWGLDKWGEHSEKWLEESEKSGSNWQYLHKPFAWIHKHAVKPAVDWYKSDEGRKQYDMFAKIINEGVPIIAADYYAYQQQMQEHQRLVEQRLKKQQKLNEQALATMKWDRSQVDRRNAEKMMARDLKTREIENNNLADIRKWDNQKNNDIRKGLQKVDDLYRQATVEVANIDSKSALEDVHFTLNIPDLVSSAAKAAYKSGKREAMIRDMRNPKSVEFLQAANNEGSAMATQVHANLERIIDMGNKYGNQEISDLAKDIIHDFNVIPKEEYSDVLGQLQQQIRKVSQTSNISPEDSALLKSYFNTAQSSIDGFDNIQSKVSSFLGTTQKGTISKYDVKDPDTLREISRQFPGAVGKTVDDVFKPTVYSTGDTAPTLKLKPPKLSEVQLEQYKPAALYEPDLGDPIPLAPQYIPVKSIEWGTKALTQIGDYYSKPKEEKTLTFKDLLDADPVKEHESVQQVYSGPSGKTKAVPMDATGVRYRNWNAFNNRRQVVDAHPMQGVLPKYPDILAAAKSTPIHNTIDFGTRAIPATPPSYNYRSPSSSRIRVTTHYIPKNRSFGSHNPNIR